MSADQNDPRYRTGWDSYPGDYTNGQLNDRGRAAHDYMDRQGDTYSKYRYNNSGDYRPERETRVPQGGGGGWG